MVDILSERIVYNVEGNKITVLRTKSKLTLDTFCPDSKQNFLLLMAFYH